MSVFPKRKLEALEHIAKAHKNSLNYNFLPIVKLIPKSNKLLKVSYDIRGAVMAEAKRLEESGQGIIHLNLGNLAPFGFEPPAAIVQEMVQHLPAAAGYAESKGVRAVRAAIQEETRQKKIAGVTIDDIYLGNGVSELIVMSMQGLLNDADQVLLPAPDYPLWTAAVNLSGGAPVHYLCDEQNGWLPDLDDIRAKITPKTRALVIINPNNPTGALYPDSVLRELVEIARRHELIIFSDEIYDKLIYDGLTHTAIASLSDDVMTVTFNGLSKNYCLCGYRAGWMVVSGLSGNMRQRARDYLDALNTLSSMRLCANVPAQYAVLAALKDKQSPAQLVAPGGRLFEQRELAYQMLNQIPGVSCVKPQAALYMFVRLDPTFYPIANDQRFILDLLIQEQVLVVQGSGFNWPTPDHFRVVFLPKVDELREAITRIARFLDGYPARGA